MRLANTEKAGYYPTPDPVTDLIRSYITAPEGGRILDPCAGQGEALIPLARDLDLIPYGVELAIDRAQEAERRVRMLIHTRLDAGHLTGRHLLKDSFFGLVAPKDSFNLIYANPPYLQTEEDGRAEYAWLRDCRPYLQPGGLLVWVIPRHLLYYEKTAPYLLTWFDQVQIFRFPDPFYEQFKQVIVFGVRRESRAALDIQQVRQMRTLGQPIQAVDIEPLPAAAEPVYTLPALTVPQADMRFRGFNANPQEVAEEAHEHGVVASKVFQAIINPLFNQAQVLRPVTPMKIGHLVGVVAAGFLNNQVLETDAEEGQDRGERLLIKGLSFKDKQVEVETRENLNPDDDAKTIETTTSTDKVITSITTVTPNGDVEIHEGAKLTVFMERWLPVLTKVIADKYPPLYNFDYNGYEAAINKLNLTRKIPIVNRPGLLPAQKHTIAAAATRLEQDKDCWIDGEMGTGKTIMGTGIPAIMATKGYDMKHMIILCPPHLVAKWQREIKFVWPKAEAMALSSREDIDRFFAHPGPIFGVMKETTARAGSGWNHAYDYLGPIMHKPRGQGDAFDFLHTGPFLNGQAQKLPEPLKKRLEDLRKRRFVRCPVCGAVSLDDEGTAAIPSLTFTRKQEYCRKCKHALYQDARRMTADQKINTFRHFARRTAKHPQQKSRFENILAPTNEGYAKYPLATYIKRHYKGKLDMLIADECHQYKATDSDRGFAYHRLAVAAKKILNLTGTSYGGKASTLFSLLYRSSSDMRHAYSYDNEDGLKKWLDQYGIMQEITEVKFDENGMQSGNSKSRTRVKELPGAAPAMLPWLLNRAVFISLKDMGMALPSYEEIPVGVWMEPVQRELYLNFERALAAAVAERMQRNDKSLLAGYLQALLSWPDSPWRAKMVVDKRRLDQGYHLDECIIAQVPELPDDQLYPKEEEIIDLIKEEKKNGRRVLLLCQQTATLDITPQWLKMLKAEGLKAVVLKVDPGKREAWVKQQVEKENVDVIISHPKRVETGLDLLDFPTIVWMGTEYSVYTILQASRRSWRIGQDRPVKVYFYYYYETLQAQAIRLIAAKVGAALRVRGDTLPDDSLAELDELAQSDMITELTKIMLQGDAANQVESLEDIFAQANAAMKQEEALVGGFDTEAIFNEMTPAPEPESSLDGCTVTWKKALIVPSRQGVVAVPTGVDEATILTSTSTYGPNTVEKRKHTTTPGKRLVFGVGLVDESEVEKHFKPADLTSNRSAVIPQKPQEPEPCAAAETTGKEVSQVTLFDRLVFGRDQAHAHKAKRRVVSSSPAQLGLFG